MFVIANYLDQNNLSQALFISFSFRNRLSHANVSCNTGKDNSQKQSLLQKIQANNGRGIDFGSGVDIGNFFADRIGRIRYTGSFIGLLFLARLEFSSTNKEDLSGISICKSRRQQEKCGYVYSSTWIPSAGTSNSPLLMIFTGLIGLSPGAFGTFSIFSTIS